MKKFFVLVVLVLIACGSLFAQQKVQPKIIVKASVTDLMGLFNGLLEGILPSKPENAYMPELMKTKINWLYNKDAEVYKVTGNHVINVALDPERQWQNTLAHSFYVGPYPGVNVIADKLYELVRIEGRMPVGYSQINKNTFALSIVHEAVHLEQSPEYFNALHSRKIGIVEEEFRTWSKVDRLVVEPLILMGQPVDEAFLNGHKWLVACKYAMPCKELTDTVVFKKAQ